MKLDPIATDKLKVVFRTDYGQELTDTEAGEIGSRLLRLAELLCRQPATDGRIIPPPQVHSRGF